MFRTIADLERDGWDFDGQCLACLVSGQGRTVVRQHRNGTFGVLVVRGGSCRVVKELPTLERARAYQFAMHK